MPVTQKMIYRFFKAPRDSIHLLKGILEAYEGMCVLSTIDRDNSIVQVAIAPDFQKNIEEVIEYLRPRMGLHDMYPDIDYSLGRF